MFYINSHLARRRLAVTITTFLLVFGSMLIVQSAVAESDGFHLEGGDVIRPDEFIESLDGNFRLAMNGSGNIIMYGMLKGDWQEFWKMLPGQMNSADRLVAGTDGDLVIYDKNDEILWHSDTAGYDCSEGFELRIENDDNDEDANAPYYKFFNKDNGRLVYYGHTGPNVGDSNDRDVIWDSSQAKPWQAKSTSGSTGIIIHDPYGLRCNRGFFPDEKLEPGEYIRSENGNHELHMLANGNVALYDGEGTWLWDMNTGGENWIDSWLTLQADGNLVVYQTFYDSKGNTSKFARWNSHTWFFDPENQETWKYDPDAVIIYSNGSLGLWSTYINEDYWNSDTAGKWRCTSKCDSENKWNSGGIRRLVP